MYIRVVASRDLLPTAGKKGIFLSAKRFLSLIPLHALRVVLKCSKYAPWPLSRRPVGFKNCCQCYAWDLPLSLECR